VVAEDGSQLLEITETLVQWELEWEMLTAEVQEAAEDHKATGNMEQAEAAEALEEQDSMQEIVLKATEQAHQDILVELVGVQVLQVAELE
jgi:hypothetical protein